MRETNKNNITTVSIRLNPDKEDDRKIMDILDGIIHDEELSGKYGGKTGYIKMAILKMASDDGQSENQLAEDTARAENTEGTESTGYEVIKTYAYADVEDEEGYVDIDIVCQRFGKNGYLIPPKIRYHH